MEAVLTHERDLAKMSGRRNFLSLVWDAPQLNPIPKKRPSDRRGKESAWQSSLPTHPCALVESPCCRSSIFGGYGGAAWMLIL
jgi:hypothetical protein